MLNWIFTELAHWNKSPWVDMMLHSETLSGFRANQSLLQLLKYWGLAEKQQIPILWVFGLNWKGCKPTIYHTNHHTTAVDTTHLKFYWNVAYAILYQACLLDDLANGYVLSTGDDSNGLTHRAV